MTMKTVSSSLMHVTAAAERSVIVSTRRRRLTSTLYRDVELQAVRQRTGYMYDDGPVA